MKKSITILTFGVATILSTLNAQEFNINKGWNLLGSSYKVKNLSNINSSCIDYIWQYRDSSWELFTNLNIAHNYKKSNSIESKEGFWLYSNSNCTINLNSSFTGIIGTFSQNITIEAITNSGNSYKTSTHTDTNSSTQTLFLELPSNTNFTLNISLSSGIKIPLSYEVNSTKISDFILNDESSINLGYINLESFTTTDLDNNGVNDESISLDNISNLSWQISDENRSDLENSETNENNEESSEEHIQNGAATYTLPTSYSANVGRLLASGCANCHGTNGISNNSIESIRGEDELLEEMSEHDGIMRAQAKGFTSTEIKAMETWLNSL